MSPPPRPATTAIHGVPHRRPDWTPVAPAIQQSSTFVAPVGSDEDILYSRYGNNPTQQLLAAKYARLEGAEDALFLSSGMGATALAHLAVLRPGDHLVSSSWIYGGTQHLFDQELTRFGIDVSYVRPDQPRLWRSRSGRPPGCRDPDQPAHAGGGPRPVAPWRAVRPGLPVDATSRAPINFRHSSTAPTS
jgi:cystathionine beta-lyase/cystathionine gamma-synthase